MTLHWFIDSREKFVEITAEDGVTHADVVACLDAVVGADALGYRKLVDCMAGSLAMNAGEVMSIVARVRELHRGTIGAAALVLPDDSVEPLSRLLGALASADRPLRLFNNKAAARHWIERLRDPVADKSS